MLYIEDLDEAKKFWTEKLGFVSLNDIKDPSDMRQIEITTKQNGASIVLIDKSIFSQMEPELNLGTPSLMFFTEDAEKLYRDFSNKKIIVGKLVTMPSGEKVFNFADDEGNYFAVMERLSV